MDNYYKILGVENFASIDEIKIAYKKLSKKFHPDVNDGDKFFEEKFKELQKVYESLSDLNIRAVYDEHLKKSLKNSNLNFNIPSQNETKNTSPSQPQRRSSPFIFEKGRFVKRRRLII